jgi:tripartite-type tricarboxylate transporter receptor subunit TctC
LAKDLVALGRDKPGAILFGSTGAGSITHLALELFQSAAGSPRRRMRWRSAPATSSSRANRYSWQW